MALESDITGKTSFDISNFLNFCYCSNYYFCYNMRSQKSDGSKVRNQSNIQDGAFCENRTESRRLFSQKPPF